MSKHTPTPWTSDWNGGEPSIDTGMRIRDSAGTPIAYISNGLRQLDVETANAEHIVKCVNAHDDLVAFVKEHATGAAENIRRTLAVGDTSAALAIVSMFEVNTAALLTKLEGGAK